MVKVFLIIILTFLLNQKLNALEISGIPKVIDGDTVHINNKKIRLEGIDAPEIRQPVSYTHLTLPTSDLV